MDSQNPDHWELLLEQLPDNPIQFSQPLISRQRMWNDAETSKRRVQPRSDLGPQQLSLISLQPDTRALIIVLKAEIMFIGAIK
jgi:hypothetical protein